MLDPKSALDALQSALDSAKRAGADAADAVFAMDETTSISALNGEVEDITRSEDAELGLRVFTGVRTATVVIQDMTADAVTAAAERAVAMARASTDDPYARLARPDELAAPSDIDLDLDDGHDPDLAALEQAALACEAAALAVDGVSKSGGSGSQSGRALYALATSNGFAGVRTGSRHAVYASAIAIAGSGSGMERDYAQAYARHSEDLESAETIGRRAGDRTAARLGPGKLKSGTMPVLFDPRVSNTLLGHLLGAMSGPAIARGTSFLSDPEESLFPPQISIVDDPHRRRGLRSRLFDGEGLPVGPRKLVAEGRLAGWLLNLASAEQLGLAPNGYASRGASGSPGISGSNIHLEPGALSRDDLIRETGNGVLVTELIGQGVNGVTGDYSRGASGFLIENGELTSPVSEITVAGNLKRMFAALTAASDLEFRHSTNAPTLRIDGMTVAGG
ncbi:modulator protein [Pacificimonas flava]|uniref:Modulator protein n=2 Tax=Pacificimonas TaxID=1960290 RepID=A0A219B5Z6_9SPHN|nr:MULTISPECIES: metallopeptidase TldD-related protein [Pacificimonas]MBZ6377029.1 TldD/PmbA family protein [Pacificimonas aurantium]OWV33229.1 modulator protein [Pacificimonas flava]